MNRIKNRLIVPALLVMVSLLGLTACKENKEDVSPTPEATEDYVLETVEEQVLFDESGVKVTVNGIVDSETYGKGISLTFENTTMKALTFDCKKMIINGVMAPDLFGDRVQPGDTVDIVGYFGTGMLNYLGIDNIGEIKLEFDCYDTESYNSVYRSELISIKTSEYDNMDTENSFDGEKLYEGMGLTIYGKMTSDDIFNKAMLLYIENNSDLELMYKAEGITIDGEFIEYIYGFTMCAQSDKLFYLDFGNEESENSDAIGSEYSINFEVFDRADTSSIGKTGDLTVKMQ